MNLHATLGRSLEVQAFTLRDNNRNLIDVEISIRSIGEDIDASVNE